jgi:hypothetical protein
MGVSRPSRAGRARLEETKARHGGNRQSARFVPATKKARLMGISGRSKFMIYDTRL